MVKIFIWLATGVFSAAHADPGAAGEATAYLIVPIMMVMMVVTGLKWMTGSSKATPRASAPSAADPNASKWSQMSPITKYGGGCVAFFLLVAVLGVLADIASHVGAP